MHVWELPKEWQGRKVRLVAQDHCSDQNCWMGIGEISAGQDTAAFALARAAYRTALLLYSETLFLAPGMALCLVLARFRVRLEIQTLVAAILIGGGLASYSLLWFYLIGPVTGRAASFLTILTSLLIVYGLRIEVKRLDRRLIREVILCLLLVTSAAAFYNALGFLYASDEGAGEVAQVRYLPHQLPPDNILPEMFADRLLQGKSVRPTLFGYWQSSDRPPLEAAITLLELPLSFGGTPVLQYQVLGVFLQATFIAGIWIFLRAIQIESGIIIQVLCFCIFSQFCLLHSFYVWAKLLSATFCFASMAFWFPRLIAPYPVIAPLSRIELIGSAVCMGLGLLCHPGVGFTMLGILLVVVVKRRLPDRRSSALALAAFVLVLLPWKAYQTFYDPPGDNLLKAHLAGVIDLKHSLSYSVINAYRHLSPAQFLANKLENVTVLFTGPWLAGFTGPGWNSKVGALWESSFFLLSCSLGVLNLGFILRLINRKRTSRAIAAADLLLAMACASIAIWCLIMFTPGSTLVHQGSFANVLMLFVGLAIYIRSFAPRLASALLVVQICVLFPIFVFARPLFAKPNSVGDGPIDLGMALVAVMSVTAMGYIARRMSRLD
ncbi:MAG: hypothetical protein M3Z09_15690 [Acidobacteriota bacterium]|nr:hypothetical protein [Acidobacteriota bacterium]